MKLMILPLISVLLATGVEAKPFSEKKCQKKGPSPPPYKFESMDSLKEAVQAYDANPASAEEKYGPIAGWDVSAITDMSSLFYELENFNADISNWDTSRVTDMKRMFDVRSAARTLPPQPPVARGLRVRATFAPAAAAHAP